MTLNNIKLKNQKNDQTENPDVSRSILSAPFHCCQLPVPDEPWAFFCSGSRAVLSVETMFEASKLGRSSSKASPMPSPLGPPSSSTVSSLSLSGWSLSLGGQYDSYKAQVPVFRNSPPPPPEPMFRFSDTT